MYCPECLSEYREGFTRCADCDVPLTEGAPPAPPAPEPGMELVTVLEANDPVLIELVKGLFDEAAIPYFVPGDYARRIYPLDGMIVPYQRVQVPREREEEARELLAEIEEGGTEPDAGA